MAHFYKGFAFERDVHGRLTIEGAPVETDGADDLSSDETLIRLAGQCIDGPKWLGRRERVKQQHLRILRTSRDHRNAGTDPAHSSPNAISGSK